MVLIIRIADPSFAEDLLFESFDFRGDPYITGHVDQDVHIGPGKEDHPLFAVAAHPGFHQRLIRMAPELLPRKGNFF